MESDSCLNFKGSDEAREMKVSKNIVNAKWLNLTSLLKLMAFLDGLNRLCLVLH